MSADPPTTDSSPPRAPPDSCGRLAGLLSSGLVERTDHQICGLLDKLFHSEAGTTGLTPPGGNALQIMS